MIQFRDDQVDIINKGMTLLTAHNMLYLALEMRLGKTLISLELARQQQAKSVLFVTVKKAIPSIRRDYEALNVKYNLTVINYESVGKATGIYDFIILDEAHNLGAFPVPTQKTIQVRRVIDRQKSCKLMWLSGTPNIESTAQLFHQLVMSPHHAFRLFKNFYAFHRDYGITNFVRGAGGMQIQDYSKLKPEVSDLFLKPIALSLTKKEAEFKQYEPEIEVVNVAMPKELYVIYSKIEKEGISKIDDDTILADSAVKVMGKLSQLSSGSVIGENKTGLLSLHKVNKIIEIINQYKSVVVFYRYKGDLELLKQCVCNYTLDVEKWRSDPSITLLLQTKSGSRGIDLSKAEVQVYMTLEFSGETWTQGIDRQAHMNRETPYLIKVLCSMTPIGEETIDHKIFKTITKKQDFNVSTFRSLK